MRDLDIQFYLSILLKRLPWAAVIVTVCTLAGVAIALSLPPTFRASAKILIEQPQIPADMARSTVPISSIQQFQVIQQEVTTRESLIELAKGLKVYGAKPLLSEQDIAQDMRGRIIFQQTPIEQIGPDAITVFTLSFDAGDPDLAAAVANRLTDQILARNHQERSDRAGETTSFFARDVEQLGSALAQADAEILKFKTANEDALPDGLEFRRTLQKNQQERLAQIEREEAALRSRRDNLVQMFETTGQIASAGPVSPEQQMIQDLNRALSEQLTLFSEESPNIVALRTRIASLQKNQKAPTVDNKRKPSEFTLQLSDIDERIATLRHEKPMVQSSLSALKTTIAATPAVETRLNALTRVRDNLQAQFKLASDKLGDASRGEQVEKGAKGGRISIVESATPPQDRIGPNRRRIAALGTLAGIGLAVVLIGVLELLNQTIRRPSELAKLINAEPLAVIPNIGADATRPTLLKWLSERYTEWSSADGRRTSVRTG